MKQIASENEILLFCEKRAEGLYILRCQTSDSILKLPDGIDGESIIGLGDYVCAAREPDLSKRKIQEIHLTCGAHTPPAHDAQAIHKVILPDTLRTIGSYTFYNCYHLKCLDLPASVQEIGYGVLMNCTDFHEVILRGNAAGKTCLPDLLGQTSGEVEVTLSLPSGQVRLLFPPYQEQWEDLTPAHVFQQRIEGAGYPYRQCFQNGVLSLIQYDMALERLMRIQDYATAVRVALNRLRWSAGLSEAARTVYEDCLYTHADLAAEILLKQRDIQGIHALLRFGVLSQKGLHHACDLARQMGQTEAMGILLAATGGAALQAHKQYDL